MPCSPSPATRRSADSAKDRTTSAQSALSSPTSIRPLSPLFNRLLSPLPEVSHSLRSLRLRTQPGPSYSAHHLACHPSILLTDSASHRPSTATKTSQNWSLCYTASTRLEVQGRRQIERRPLSRKPFSRGPLSRRKIPRRPLSLRQIPRRPLSRRKIKRRPFS